MLHRLSWATLLHHSTWETRYVLLLWLSILVLVPFDLRTVDSSLSDLAPAAADDADDGEQRSTLVESIISTCKEYLADPGAVRDAAAVCLSRLLTRYVPGRLPGTCVWVAHGAVVCAPGLTWTRRTYGGSWRGHGTSCA